jgi:FkbM family methyltransferase
MATVIEILAGIGRRIGKPPGWERVVRWFASPESCRDMPDICVVCDGIVFLAQPSVPLGWHVTFFGSYEPELREIFRAVLPAGAVAIDVGANVGWHALLMAKLVGQGGRVLAAEANPSVRERLEGNLRANHFSHVAVIPHAIAEAEGILEFYGPQACDAGSGDGHVIGPGGRAAGATIRVEARSLDSIVELARVDRLDLVKIDVEGFEWPVLRGAEKSVAKFRPHIVFEYNAEYAMRGGGTPELFTEYFDRHRYRLFAVGRNWAEAVAVGRWPRCADIWAVPSA